MQLAWLTFAFFAELDVFPLKKKAHLTLIEKKRRKELRAPRAMDRVA